MLSCVCHFNSFSLSLTHLLTLCVSDWLSFFLSVCLSVCMCSSYAVPFQDFSIRCVARAICIICLFPFRNSCPINILGRFSLPIFVQGKPLEMLSLRECVRARVSEQVFCGGHIKAISYLRFILLIFLGKFVVNWQLLKPNIYCSMCVCVWGWVCVSESGSNSKSVWHAQFLYDESNSTTSKPPPLSKKKRK